MSLEEGVSHNLIFCMHQDRLGFLWFGTMYGLVRHDGRSWLSYRHDPHDPTSLSNDDIVCLAEDAAGDLWIGTFGGGLNHLDRATGEFRRYLPRGPDATHRKRAMIWDLAFDRGGRLWIATFEGVERLDPATGEIESWRHRPDDPRSLSSNQARSLVVDRAGRVWVGTLDGGLNRFDAATGEFDVYLPDPEDEGSVSGRHVSDLLEDASGTLWIATQDGGLCRRRGDDTFERIDPDGTRYANTLALDRNGALWVGTAVGLRRVDPETGETTRYDHDPQDRRTLRGTNVVAILPDRSGVLWVGTYLGGLDRAAPGRRRFASYGEDLTGPRGPAHRSVHALLEDRRGTLWIGTKAGLVVSEGSEVRRHVHDRERSDTVEPGPVNALLEDREGRVWVATGVGLSRYEGNGRFRSWRHDPSDSTSLATYQLRCLVQDRDGALWVGTGAGLDRFDSETGVAEHFAHDPEDPHSLPDDTVLSLHEDRRGRLWVGTYAGLARMGPERDGFERFAQDPYDPGSLSNNYAFDFLEDEAGTLWIATAGGLHRFEESTGTFRYYTESDGLPNAVVSAILANDVGQLWLSTHRGLSLFDPRSETFTNFDRGDGLPSNLLHAGSACRRADGELLFGGLDGYVGIGSSIVEIDDDPPPIAFTAFRGVGDRGNGFDPNFLSSIELGHRESFFTFEFAALDYRRPDRHRYAYRLEGLDDDWIEADASGIATYTNVPPGRYVFRARGATSAGVWNEEGVSIPLVVAPPFWRTAWFLALVVVAVVGSALLAHRIRVRARLSRYRELEQTRIAERDRVRRRAADDFHDELGHRLTKIGLFSEMVRRQLTNVSEDVEHYLERIIDESHHLSRDTRDFIWTLGGGNSLRDLVLYLQRFGEDLFDRTDVLFSVRGLSDELETVELTMDSRRHLTLIFKEAMNNALRHSQCRHVELRVDTADGQFSLALGDDGKGYSGNVRGNGHGLKNMERRAQKIRGTIRIESHPGSGSTVTLTRRT